MRLPGWGVTRLCYARDFDLRVGYRVVVETEAGEFIGRVTLTPRRREPYTEPYEILRIATPRDEREERRHGDLGREVYAEARKLARDYRIEGVTFIGCDISLDGSYAEVKYQAEGEVDTGPVMDGLERAFDLQVRMKRFSFIERSSDTSGCDTCGLPLCCSVWSGARSMGPVNVRIARQQGVTPNEKIIGCCGEVKCCMRYEHDTYKEFKERAPLKNSTVVFEGQEGKVTDYAMVKDSVFVRFDSEERGQELIPLGRLARDNPGVIPGDLEDWEVSDSPEREPDS